MREPDQPTESGGLPMRSQDYSEVENWPGYFASVIWSRVPEALRPRLTAIEVDFADMQVPDCDLVNASFALPFCKPESFVDQDCRGDSPGWSVCWSVLWGSRHLGGAPRSDAPQPGRGDEAAGGL